MKRVFAIAALAALGGHAGTAVALPWPGTSARARGGLFGAVHGFKSYERCVASLASRLPAELASLLPHRAPLTLVCRAIEAAARDDRKACDAIRDYKARRHCWRFYGIFTGRPPGCPQMGYPARQEGLCGALSSRNPSLCLAAKPAERAFCRALLGQRGACAKLRGADKLRCRLVARTWRGVVVPTKPTLPARFRPRLKVKVTALTPGIRLPPKARAFSSDQLDYGVLVADRPGKGDWFIIDRNFAPREVYTRLVHAPLRLTIRLPLAGKPPVGTHALTGGVGGDAEASLARAPYRHVKLRSTAGTVKISAFSRRPGHRVSGSFDIELSDGVDRIKVEGKLDTFVRSAVPLAHVARYMQYKTNPGRRYQGLKFMRPKAVRANMARIRKVSSTLYHVDPKLRDELARDTRQLLYGFLAPRGQARGGRGRGGYRLYTVYKNSPLWLLGFRKGDVVTKINGRTIDRREDAFTAYARLRRARKLIVELERGGNTIKVTYRVCKVRARRKKGG